MIKKKKGPATRKPTSPRPKEKSKCPVNFKQATSKNQYLLLRFDKDHRDLTFDEAGAILVFVLWLQKNDYIILDIKGDIKGMVKLRIEAVGGG